MPFSLLWTSGIVQAFYMKNSFKIQHIRVETPEVNKNLSIGLSEL